MKTHTGNNGGIIASGDTEMLHHGRDTYSYVWPRDGAYIAHAFDKTGYSKSATSFYDFISRCIEPEGYLMHKYRSDRKLGSSWHPWVIDGKPILPIQVDETAIVLFVLWKHYERYRDIEFIESLYNSFIEPAANFLVEYTESTTGLPQASFDLWEENHATSTYTAASVVGALSAATKFAQLLSKEEPARTYEVVAERMRTAIGDVLFDEEKGYFVKHVRHDEVGIGDVDATVDSSSLYGLLFFEVFDTDDERVKKMVRAIEEKLAVHGDAKGYIRYEGDNYYKMLDAETPNPWIITTLWLAEYYTAIATSKDDLKKPLEIIEWSTSHATASGMLAEQMHPNTRAHLSTAPLVWSHAEYVLAIQAYLEKYEELTKLQ